MDDQDMVGYDEYARCLAKALCYVVTPVTVGLYAPWGSGGDILLVKIKRFLNEGSKQIEDKVFRETRKRPRSADGPLGLLALVFRLLFFLPLLSESRRERRNVRFVFVSFKAWEFAGSKRLWAGLVMTLCEEVRRQFRPLPTSIFRALGANSVPRSGGDGDREWEPKTLLCLPLWAAAAVLVFVLVAFVAVVVSVGFPSRFGGDLVSAVEGLGASVVGVSTFLLLKSSLAVVSNLVWTQKDQVKKLMDKKDFSAELGFMNSVKQEVRLVTNFLHFVEVFERRKICVVLNIQDLDRCRPEKIVEVLEAMSILLSDKEARFISIISVDPSVVVESVEQVRAKDGAKNCNGYELLNRLVDLPFCVPTMDDATKSRLLDDLVNKTRSAAATPMRNPEDVVFCGDENDLMEEAVPLRQNGSCVDSTATRFWGRTNEAIVEAHHALRLPGGKLCKYVERNVHTMRRIVNTVSVSVNLLLARQGEFGIDTTPEKLAAWTVLSTQWPGSLSWLLQCLDDMAERQKLDEWMTTPPPQNPSKITDATRLWDIFRDCKGAMSDLLEPMQRLLQMDGDPEEFEEFLDKDHCFTVGEVNSLLLVTVNLDQSIQRQMELLRSKYRIQTQGKKGKEAAEPRGQEEALRGIVSASRFVRIYALSPEDVCKQMEELILSPGQLGTYQARVMEHRVSGGILLNRSEEEIRKMLGMVSAVDWGVFRRHFKALLAGRRGDRRELSTVRVAGCLE